MPILGFILAAAFIEGAWPYLLAAVIIYFVMLKFI